MTKFTLKSVGFKAETRDIILEIKEKTMEEKIKDLEEQIEIIQERLAELKETGKAETKRWRAEENEIYYIINGYCDIKEYADIRIATDNRRYEIGNYFKTEEQAEQKLEHLKIEQQLKDIALRLNNGVEIDWEDDSQFKYFLSYDNKYDYIEEDYLETFKYQGGIYCLNENFKDTAIAEIGEERLKNYLKEC